MHDFVCVCVFVLLHVQKWNQKGRGGSQRRFAYQAAKRTPKGKQMKSLSRVGQNHIYTVCIRYFWQGNHRIYGHTRCIYTALADTELEHKAKKKLTQRTVPVTSYN
jgi:hypothetical protein